MSLLDYVKMAKPPARPKVVFLISAQLQSGKDTLANGIVAAHGVRRTALADPVKEACIAILGMPSAVAYGGEAERRAWSDYGRDGRQWLQWMGTELGRNQIHPDVWIHRMLERISVTAVGVIVVPDVRFKNELGLKKIAELKPYFTFVLVRLKRPGNENNDPHQSESEQLSVPDSEFDEVIVNDKEPKDLEAHGRRLVAQYVPRY